MKLNRLNARTVATITKPGRHADGGNLYLVVSPTGSKSWSFFFRWKADTFEPGAGKMRELGLGPLGAVSLALARQLAAEAREQVARGIDPIAERRKKAAAKSVATFGEVAEAYIRVMEPAWRNAKHIAQWRSTLSLEREEDGTFTDGGYCAAIRDKAVDQVSTEDVLAILTPVWVSKNETASRVRGRIEAVLDAAKAKGLRSGENPARWKGHLALTLPKRQRLQRGNHAALPYADLPAFVRRLRLVRGMSSFALEFAILTAARSGEVRGARWREIDLDARLWTIPPERTKSGRIHRVPLANRAVEILQTVGQLGRELDRFVFPGMRKGSQLSDTALTAILRRLEVNATAHGFRSTFRDWAGDTTSFPREVAEAALAHAVGDATELAYRRGDALEKRRELMDAWDAFVCTRSPDRTSAAE